MKTLHVFFYLSLISLALSCGEAPVVFTEPLPKDRSEDPFFNPFYRGLFLCESDSAYLIIDHHLIYKEKAFLFEMTEEEIEDRSDIEMIGDQIYIKNLQQFFPYRFEDGFVRGDVVLRDTLFHIGPNAVAKYYKGHQILNIKLEEDRWETWILSLDQDQNLALLKTILPEDLEALETITPVENISTENKIQYRINPTAKELDEILRTKLLFESCDQFTRLLSGETIQ